MHSARRQKGAKIISSLYDEEDDDDEIQAPVRTKATFKTRAKKELKRPTKPSIHDEEDEDVVIKPKITLGKRRLFKPMAAKTAEKQQDESIYTDDYIESLKTASAARKAQASASGRSTETPDAEMPDVPKEGTTIADLDLGTTEIITLDDEDVIGDEDDEYIPLDPETIAEERELLEAELYNEQDLEEGVGFQDEELALDNRQRDAQEDDRRREMREAIAEYEDELLAAPSVGLAVHDAVARDATRAAAAAAVSSVPGTGANGHPPPPLPVLAESLSRLRARLADLTAQRAEHRAGLDALDTERTRIAERQAELQAGLDQAGLDYQLARVALDARRAAAHGEEGESLESS